MLRFEQLRRCMKLCSPRFCMGSSLLPCPFELEVTHGADKLLFLTESMFYFVSKPDIL